MNTTYPQKTITAHDLQLGDVVQIFHDKNFQSPWNTAIVKRIDGDNITLYRPYGISNDWSYTGGVICYMGLEEFTITRNTSGQFYLHSRTELK